MFFPVTGLRTMIKNQDQFLSELGFPSAGLLLCRCGEPGPCLPRHHLLQAAPGNAHQEVTITTTAKNSDICTATQLTSPIGSTHLTEGLSCGQSTFQVIKGQMEEMLVTEIIEQQTSRVVLVPKVPDPKPRFCVDQRKVNAFHRCLSLAIHAGHIGIVGWSWGVHYLGPPWWILASPNG